MIKKQEFPLMEVPGQKKKLPRDMSLPKRALDKIEARTDDFK